MLVQPKMQDIFRNYMHWLWLGTTLVKYSIARLDQLLLNKILSFYSAKVKAKLVLTPARTGES